MDTNPPIRLLRNSGRLLAALALLSGAVWLVGAHPPDKHHRITPQEELAVVQAIQDEMYDEGCQGWVGDLADSHEENDVSRMHVYIPPEMGPQGLPESYDRANKGLGWLIYKFMPIGEVYREFWFRDDGLAVLGGNPQWNFPVTEPSYRTIYMDDEQLSQFKHDWAKTSFTVELHPSAERLREAAQRQKLRFEGDYRPHKRDCSFDWR